MSVSDFKLGWCLTFSEPDGSNCTEMKSVDQPFSRDLQKHPPHLNADLEQRHFLDLFLISDIYPMSFDCLKLWDNTLCRPALGTF